MVDDELDPKEMSLMVRCIQLYYRQQRQQREIAQLLDISTSKVSRLLKRAYAEGIVRVDINLRPLPSLAARLIELYRLRDAVVIPSGSTSDTKEDLGIAAARYFERIAGTGVKVGLSAGLTLYYMVKHLRERIIKNLAVYPLAAESTLRFVDLFPNTLVGMMTAKYRPDVIGYAMHAFVGWKDQNRRSLQSLLKQNAELRGIYEEAKNVDVAVVGVGSISSDSPGFSVLAEYYGISSEKLKSTGAVAEVNYQPIDAFGHPLSNREIEKLSSRVLAVRIERLTEMSKQHGRHVIAVAGGSHKSGAIRAVLRGGIVNVLITDREVAESLLREE